MVTTIIPTVTGGFTHMTRLMPLLSQEPTEIIVIDNDSKDGTANYLSNYNCLLKVNKIRMNFSQSNNYGVSKAAGDKILFLNNDTQIFPGLIKTMEDTFAIDDKIAVVGAQLCMMDSPKKVQHAGVMFTDSYFPYELGLAQPFGVPELPFNDPRVQSVREVPSVTAACMMVRKDVFLEAGGFNEDYMFGWEDTDLNLKIRELGYKVYYNGNARALHKHFGSKDRGRFERETQNRALYESIWVTTGRAQKVLKSFINNL